MHGVEWCHQHAVVHRDIKVGAALVITPVMRYSDAVLNGTAPKPENLLVDPEQQTLKLCDFGFSRYLLMPISQ